MVRTRVRLARLTSARWRACAARFKTDFFFFLTLVACPWAIYRSLGVSFKLLTLNEALCFVKRGQKSTSDSVKRHLPIEYAADLTPVVAAKEARASWNAPGWQKTA